MPATHTRNNDIGFVGIKDHFEYFRVWSPRGINWTYHPWIRMPSAHTDLMLSSISVLQPLRHEMAE